MKSSKQFVIDRILDQARIEAISLTDIEIRMLRFTEASAGSEDLEAAKAFERDYNEDEYEAKIADLIRHAHARDRKARNVEGWNQALPRLASRDLYLNVLIDRAGIIDSGGLFGGWRFLLYGILPPALCLAAAVLFAFSPMGARFVRNDALRLLIAICFLGMPFLLQRQSKARRALRPRGIGRIQRSR